MWKVSCGENQFFNSTSHSHTDHHCQVVAGRGNNLHEVVDHSGDSFLVSMPTKFRRNVWIKRGDFVIVTNIEEGDKVKAEISSILYKDQIKFIKSEGQWPEGFQAGDTNPEDQLSKLQLKDNTEERSDSEEASEEDDSDLFQNTNRPVYEASEEESDSETESEED